jgi:hypothetical protein
MKMERTQIREMLIKEIEQNKIITVKWDCGGDEAFAYFSIDEKTIDDPELSEDLEMMIINELDLPDAGEFVLEGKGRIIFENNELYIEYNSVLKELDGEEVNETAEDYSGKKILLK